jgi:MFS family permease
MRMLSTPTGIRRERLGVSVIFAVHGAVYGSFATRVPWIADHAHATPGLLGAALLAPTVGAIVSMPWGGRAIHRYGGRTVMRVLVVAWSLSLALPAFAPNVALLFAALLICGSTSGLADVAMNAQGVDVERRYGRSIMSGLHGLWSAGGVAAGAIGAVLASADVDARVHFGAAAIVLAALGGAACSALSPARLPGDDSPAFAIPSRPILLIGLVGLCAVFAEGASADWCAVYLSKLTSADPGTAAAAFTGFALAMTVGRLVGDAVVRRVGPVRTVALGGAAATAGAVIVVAARTSVVAMIGFALIGVGISVVVPLVFAAAGRAGANPAQAIAGVATIAYGSGLAAPAIVGGIAQVSSLRVSFGVVAVLCLAMAWRARALRTGPASADPLIQRDTPGVITQTSGD